MLPGAVCLWPCREMGAMNVAPIERLSWGRGVLTIILKDRRRIAVRCRGETLAELQEHHDAMRFIRFTNPPPMVLGHE